MDGCAKRAAYLVLPTVRVRAKLSFEFVGVENGIYRIRQRYLRDALFLFFLFPARRCCGTDASAVKNRPPPLSLSDAWSALSANNLTPSLSTPLCVAAAYMLVALLLSCAAIFSGTAAVLR